MSSNVTGQVGGNDDDMLNDRLMQPTANHRIRRVHMEDRLRFGTSSPIGHSSPSTLVCGLGSTKTSTRLVTVGAVA